jgi:hypothetical protein
MAQVLSAELQIRATNATGPAFAAAEKSFASLSKSAKQSQGALMGWGEKFQKEIERLNVAPREIDRVTQAWARLQRQTQGQGLRVSEWIAGQERWKNATLAQLKQVEAAEQRAIERRRKYGGLLGAVPAAIGAYGGYRALRAGAHKVAEGERERAREWLGNMSPDETAQATGAAREISSRYPSVGPVAVMEHIRQLRARFGSFEHAMGNVEELVKAQVVLQTLSAGESSGEDLEHLVLGIEGLGAGADPRKFKGLLSAFVRAKSLFPDISGEAVQTYLQRSKASKYGLGEDYLNNVAFTMIQHEGPTQFGTEQASAFSALVGQRQTEKAKAVMRQYGLLDEKTDGIVDEKGFVDNPRAWTQKNLRPQLEKQHLDLTDENRQQLIATIQRMFSNRNVGEFFTSLLVNEPVIQKDSKLLQGARDQSAAGELRNRDPFVAMLGLTEQIGAFAQVVGGPFGEKAASILNSITDAITRMSKAAGDDPEKANTIGEYGALGAGALALLTGRKLLRSGVRFLMDRPRGGAAAAGAAEGGMLGTALSWLWPAVALASLKGDTPDNPNWMQNWKVPAGWDYTRGSGGGFSMVPGSYNGSTFSGAQAPFVSSLPDFSGGAGGLSAVLSRPTAEVTGSAQLGVDVRIEPSDSFISRIVSAIRNEINVFGAAPPGGGVGTAGSTGLSMPEAGPQP